MSKIAIITGVSSGMGYAAARIYADAGYTVVGTARDISRISTDARIPGVVYMDLDIADATSIDTFYATYSSTYPTPDVLVNNAGYGLLSGFENATEIEYRRQWEVNYFGTVAITHRFLPGMRAAKK
jgi:NAD(P)-dependent dehydrogenase (short-subunit alcohol dehydrogenase family)